VFAFALRLLLLFAAAFGLAACGGDKRPSLPQPSAEVSLRSLERRFGEPTVATNSRQVRGGDDNSLSITGLIYDDEDENDAVYVQRLQYAHLGVWDTDSDTDRRPNQPGNYRYAHLANNRVAPPASGSAVYTVEGDAVYDNRQLYPDGELTADFAAGTISGALRVDGDISGDVGYDNPDRFDVLELRFGGWTLDARIITGEITAAAADAGGGNRNIFDALDGQTGDYEAAFYDDDDEFDGDPAPEEFAGTFQITDTNGAILRGGFLGKDLTD
jgi:hypothetical protein